ncbi:MAG TPA: DsbA family oxidoreductase, partial [Myxococcota bacterium]
PWCFIGKRRLEAALETLPAEERPTIRWHAYQLRPDLPEGPARDGTADFAKKFGGEARMKQLFGNVVNVGNDVGIAFDFDKPLLTNTRLAHRAVAIARDVGGADAESAVVEAFFKAHFEDHKDLGTIGVVVAIAAPLIGLDPAVLNEKLTAGAGNDDVDVDLDNGQRFGLSGVPTFILDDKLAMSGGQPVEVFQEFFAAGKKHRAG